MAFQAEQMLLGAHKHLRVHGPVRLMAAHATLQTHRSMFERKGAALVGVALGTGHLVPQGRFHLPRIQPPVGRVTIDTVNCPFLQAVAEGLGESSLCFFVAADAKLIGSLRQQMHRLFGLMNTVAVCAGQ